jgi:hypothetical protein
VPWLFSRAPVRVRHPAPCMGESSESVVCDLLGHTRDEFRELEASGVIY